MTGSRRKLNGCGRCGSPPQRGVALVAALVCITVMTALATTMLRDALRVRKSLQTEVHLRQATLLAEAGLVRAAAKLRSDGQYEGETWRVESSAIADEGDGVVAIAVEPVADSSAELRLSVTANYPAGDPRVVRRSLFATFTNAPQGSE